MRFRRITDRELGALSGITLPAGDSIVVALRRAEESQSLALVQPDSTGAFVFEDLPEGAFRLSVFADRNGNGMWDGGQLLPFIPAEPNFVAFRSSLDPRSLGHCFGGHAVRIPEG